MAVPVQIPVNTSTANGVTTVFPYSFKILRAEDLRVVDGGLVRTLNVHYTVTGVGQNTGGNITFLSPPANGNIVSRRRLMALERVTNYTNLGDLLATTLNDDQDAPVMMIQQLAALALQLIDDGAGGFAWDAKGNRIINLGSGVNATDAANIGNVLALIEAATEGGGGGGIGVAPRVYNFDGDGIETDFFLAGADVGDAAFYDTYVDREGQEPGVDYQVELADDGTGAWLRFAAAPVDGASGFAVLRGYARPWTGDTPVTSLAMRVRTLADTTDLIDNTDQNTLIGTTSSSAVTLTIREGTGANNDWKQGEYFSAVQLGDGQVTLVMEDVGELIIPTGFEAKTRAKGSVISATCIDHDTDTWLISGDMLRTAQTTDLVCMPIHDMSVLIGTNIATGTTKASFVMPFGLLLEPIASHGLYASLAVAQAAGSVLTVDVNRNGTSIINTKLTFDNAEKTTRTAATPAVYATGGDVLYAGDEITIDVDQVGTALAKGLVVYLVGRRA